MRRAFLLVVSVVLVLPRAAGAQLLGKPDRTRLLAVYGQAFDYRENQFAELLTLGFAQDRPLFGSRRFVASNELTPVFLRQGTGRPGEKEWNAAFVAGLLLAYRGGRQGDGVGYRLELGSGASYAIRHLPAGGTKFNFCDQGGATLTYRKGDRGVSLGYRMVHFSNLLLDPNPGITFHTLVLAWEWWR